MQNFWQPIVRALGTDLRPEELSVGQVTLRAVVIFIIALALIRLGHKRSLARKTAFDTVLVVIFGAILGRAINGSAAFFPTIVGAIVLVILHYLLSFIAQRSERFEKLIKGKPDVLLKDGKTLPKKLRRHSISKQDIEEDLRLRGHRGFENIEVARLERSGDISCVEKDDAG